jgi:hypothetical protein
MVPAPPSSARSARGGRAGGGRKATPRNAKGNMTPRAASSAALFAEVFGGGGGEGAGGQSAKKPEPPTSISPPFEEEEAEAEASGARGDPESIDALMDHMAKYEAPPPIIAVEDQEVRDEVGAAKTALSPELAGVLSRRVLGTAGSIDRGRASTEELDAALAELFPDGGFDMFPPVEAFDDLEYELRSRTPGYPPARRSASTWRRTPTRH